VNKQDFYQFVDQSTLKNIIEQHSTPSYFYFKKIISHKLDQLKKCFPTCFSIHYAVKANPHPEILKTMAQAQLGADVASAGELNASLLSGIPSEKIEFSGPGKTEEELALAIDRQIGSINAESLEELKKIRLATTRRGKKANVGIRINPDLKSLKSGLRMVGDTQFGIAETDIGDALNFIKSHQSSFNFTGIHVHNGSQVLDAASLVENIKLILDLAIQVQAATNLPIKKINFGGGLGINYFANQKPLDLNFLSYELSNLLNRKPYAAFVNSSKFIIEPGRFLVAESGVYATQVLYRKSIRQKNFAIVDGGMHQNYLLAGGMGQIVRRNFEMDIIPTIPPSSSEPIKLTVAGCLCTPQDVLANNYLCDHEVKVGDYIIFFNCGAYGPTASPVDFLSHHRVTEIII